MYIFKLREDALSEEKKKNRTVLGLIVMVSVFFVVLILFSIYTVRIFKSADSKGIGFSAGLSKDKIGVVEVNGVILKSKPLVELIHKAEKDEETKAIIIRVNSPGGAVAPTQEIYDEIRRIDTEYTESKGEKGKPIYASFSSVAASGGYYLGAATRRICSLPGTITGSIGVIMQFMDLSKLYEWAKLNPTTIKSGRYKDVGQPNRPMTAEEKNLMEMMTKGVHKQFIKDIMITRKGIIKGDMNEHAQGQIFSGEQAKEIGLVDELSGLWGCARNIHKELGLKDELNLKFIKKKKKMKFWDILNDLSKASSFVSDMLTQSDAPSLMYR